MISKRSIKNPNKKLQTYLANYLQNVKSELPNKYKKLKKTHNRLEKFIQKYMIDHPNYVSIIEGSVDDINTHYMQVGGEILTEELRQKMSKLVEIFTLYRNIDLTSAKQHIDIVDTQISDVLDTLDGEEFKPQNYDSLVRVLDKTKIINSLEIVKDKITLLGDRLQLEQGDVEFNKPIREFIPDDELINETYLQTIIKNLTKLLNEMKTSGLNFEEDNKTKIEQFELLINNHNRKINTSLKKLINVITKMKTYNDSIEETLRFLYVQRDLEKVPDGSKFVGKYSQKITNNFFKRNELEDLSIKIDTVQDVLTNYTPLYLDVKKIDDIYNPNFEQFIPKDTEGQAGGSLEELENLLISFKKNVTTYINAFNNYKKETKKYNLYQSYLTTHTLFYTLIITNQLFSGDYVTFNFMNRGMLTFYYRIVKNILRQIEEDNIEHDVDIIMYFKKYHYFTLKKLDVFLKEIILNTSASEVIDVLKCRNETSRRFLLLNYFKPLLESYKVKYQNKITIYARINDKSTSGAIPENGKFFVNDSTDTSVMNVIMKNCTDLKGQPDTKYNFTEVFDTINFPENGDMSKYMTLDTQLANKTGVAIMTYGYSGTGKTFTLFGKKTMGKKGMLQSTLDNISDLAEVKFRLFELYGYGLPYYEYWKAGDLPRTNDIKHELYYYNIGVNQTSLYLNGTQKTEKVSANGIKTFIDSDSGYITIYQQTMSEVFGNFDEFMELVERERECKNPDKSKKIGREFEMKKRIRDTPNNIVSSRSILIYDFQLKVGEKYVPFLIIDLPGREEIAQTYIEPFFKQKIQDILFYGILSAKYQEAPDMENDSHFNTFNDELIRIKFLLAIMALNPIAVPILNSYEVFDYINSDKFGEKNRKKLLETPHYFNFTIEESLLTTSKKTKTTKVQRDASGNYTLLEELINISGASLGSFFTIGNKSTIQLREDTGNKTLFGYRTDYQKKALMGIHIMNKLFLMNDEMSLSTIYTIFELIINKELNHYLEEGIKYLNQTERSEAILRELKGQNFKGELINEILIKTGVNLDEEIFNIVKYDYYLTPLEGIYINENIMGIIKYLSDKLIANKSDVLQTNIQTQESSNIFQNKQRMARIWLTADSFVKIDTGLTKEQRISSFYNWQGSLPNRLMVGTGDGGIQFNYAGMEEEYVKLIEMYKSNKIFCDTKPVITDVLDTYITPDDSNPGKITIDDFKVFYLFGNYEDKNVGDLKCFHQNTLLENTKDFIKVIVKN